MGTVLEGLVSNSLAKLGQLIKDEVVMTLCVGKDIKRLQKNLEGFRAVRQDAEALAMRDDAIKLWWKRISNVMFNVDDVIDLFMVHSHMRPKSSLCCYYQSMFSCFAKLLDDHSVAKRIKDINEELDEIKRASEIFTTGRPCSPQPQITIVDRIQTAPIVEPGVVGTVIKRDADDMVQEIVSRCHKNKTGVFGIQGMGGIGKTTLAQKIYYERRIRNEFQVFIWLCISEIYTETGLLKQAIRMAGGNCDQLETKAELLPVLEDTIKGNNVFLVLDDVWIPDVWINLLQSPFNTPLNACVLVTTRRQEVLQAMDTIRIQTVKKMSEHDGLILLMKNSFQPCASTFIDVGRAIVEKCDGLPLAIKVVAGTLSTRKTRREWEMIRDSQWTVDGLPEGVGGQLYLSYRELPHELKQCFLWCALLPPNYGIHRDNAANWWVAEGFVTKEHVCSIHDTAQGYYHELIRRNLLQPKPGLVDQCVSTMHDLLRSLGQHLTKDHSLFMYLENDLSLFMNVNNEGAQANLRRLGISTAVKKLPALEEHKSLRTLVLFDNHYFKSLHKNIFRKLQHIRVLVLSGTSIQNIPESIGNLVLLKLLDLSYTEINKLPKSTGRLISLEYLSLRGCHLLHSLPASLMRLYRLCSLELQDSAIDHVPRGIAKFQQLYKLRGVFESETGFRLDELQCLPNIQHLWLDKLDKATPGREHVLEKSGNLRELRLRCTMAESTHGRNCYQENEVERIQLVYDMLIPSPSLEYLFMVGFPGIKFPDWLRSEPELKMPNLCHMHLNECISCSELPPVGQMPELLVLKIEGADSVKSIGSELLGTGVTSAAAFFPKLELLLIMSMCNLESWSLNTVNPSDNNAGGNSQQLSLMPCLERLLLFNCPKLAALPEELYMIVNLKRIQIENVHQLETIANLPAVVWLKLKNNKCLKKISNLCKLQDLFVQDCPALDQAENLSSLKCLYMVDCPNEQKFWSCIPKEQGVLVHVATTGADGRNIFPDESL